MNLNISQAERNLLQEVLIYQDVELKQKILQETDRFSLMCMRGQRSMIVGMLKKLGYTSEALHNATTIREEPYPPRSNDEKEIMILDDKPPFTPANGGRGRVKGSRRCKVCKGWYMKPENYFFEKFCPKCKEKQRQKFVGKEEAYAVPQVPKEPIDWQATRKEIEAIRATPVSEAAAPITDKHCTYCTTILKTEEELEKEICTDCQEQVEMYQLKQKGKD